MASSAIYLVPTSGADRCRRRFWGLLLLLLLALPVLRASAADPVFSPPQTAVAPPADWIVPLLFAPLPANIRPEPNEEQRYLLLDRQINVATNEDFHHIVRQILTPAGIQNGATLTVDFDPNYQSLTFHWVRIWRGTNHVEQLNAGKIKLIQPERELDQFLMDGHESAVLVLDDVRVGDIIDYAYTLQGANPVLEGKFFKAVDVQLRQPVEHLVTRLVWPKERRLYARNFNCPNTRPTVAAKTNQIEYVWDARHVPGLYVEDQLPAWYDPFPWVQLSEFQTWAEVNQWALKLFQNTTPLSAELNDKIAEWRRIRGPEQQVQAVLRFVQENIRYFGVEGGTGSHRPAAASDVYGRRYGDCKDKVRLFVTILRALNIEAWPVLVNSQLHRGIQPWQPTAMAFNHVIAQVRCDNRTYWLDATANYQRGPLAAHALDDFGYGLVVQPKTTALTAIPTSSAIPDTTIAEYFQLGGRTDPASLKVVTVATGADAEDLREQFATTPRADIEKNYLHYYANRYPGAKSAAALEFKDDATQNRIEITESYSWDHFWTKPDADHEYQCTFYPSTLAELFPKPVDVERTMPLAVTFPVHRVLRTEVSLPEAWANNSKSRNITDPAFFFRMNQNTTGTKLVLEYEYRALADSVPPEQMADYMDHITAAQQTMGHTVSW
ncbi:MAG TPA: DUF3857 domain-containing protein [Dongiaceae bacterium]|nr:DUF3857 domain-containing protein [Dongiaceae bacterium]